MNCIQAHNVNQALAIGLKMLAARGVHGDSRNGPVIYMREPVTTTYEDPTARVLFSPLRDANPYFHLMESLWMLAGRNDVAWPRMFNKRFKEYSDDGKTLHGAYGFRWRRAFHAGDQLRLIVDILRKNPDDRRAVLQMWSTTEDLGNQSKDVPCNTHAYFDTRDGSLNMTVCCRSNDAYWGAYGANAVHFSFLQEYMAACIGVPVGRYSQMSNNLHVYPANIPHDLIDVANNARDSDRYTESYHQYLTIREPARNGPKRVPLVVPQGDDTQTIFDGELYAFLADAGGYDNNYPFFKHVARPMYRAWANYKLGDYAAAFDEAHSIAAGDWMLACVEWLERKRHAKMMKQAMEQPSDA